MRARNTSTRATSTRAHVAVAAPSLAYVLGGGSSVAPEQCQSGVHLRLLAAHVGSVVGRHPVCDDGLSTGEVSLIDPRSHEHALRLREIGGDRSAHHGQVHAVELRLERVDRRQDLLLSRRAAGRSPSTRCATPTSCVACARTTPGIQRLSRSMSARGRRAHRASRHGSHVARAVSGCAACACRQRRRARAVRVLASRRREDARAKFVAKGGARRVSVAPSIGGRDTSG